MQAIYVKYLGPTATKNPRYKATSSGGLTLTQEVNNDGSFSACWRRIAEALRYKMGWKGDLIEGGGTPDGKFCAVFVFTPDNGGV